MKSPRYGLKTPLWLEAQAEARMDSEERARRWRWRIALAGILLVIAIIAGALAQCAWWMQHGVTTY